MRYKDFSEYQGKFAQGRREGDGVVIDSDGTIEEVTYVGGNKKRRQKPKPARIEDPILTNWNLLI